MYMNNKILYTLVTLILLTAVGACVFYVSVSHKKIPTVVFLTKKELRESAGASVFGIRKIPQLGSNNNKLFTEVNKEVYKNLDTSCDTNDTENGYFDESYASTTLLTDSLWSIVFYHHNYCGGAHPNDDIDGHTYMLKEYPIDYTVGGTNTLVREIRLSDLFPNFKEKRSDVYRKIQEWIFKNDEEIRNDADCQSEIKKQVETYLRGDFDKKYDGPIIFSLTQKGINVLSFNLIHAMSNQCEPRGVVIPYDYFDGLIDMDLLKR